MHGFTFLISITSREAIVGIYKFPSQPPIPCFLVLRQDLSSPGFFTLSSDPNLYL